MQGFKDDSVGLNVSNWEIYVFAFFFLIQMEDRAQILEEK